MINCLNDKMIQKKSVILQSNLRIFQKQLTQMLSFFPAQSKAMPNDPERFLEMGGWHAHVD